EADKQARYDDDQQGIVADEVNLLGDQPGTRQRDAAARQETVYKAGEPADAADAVTHPTAQGADRSNWPDHDFRPPGEDWAASVFGDGVEFALASEPPACLASHA